MIFTCIHKGGLARRPAGLVLAVGVSILVALVISLSMAAGAQARAASGTQTQDIQTPPLSVATLNGYALNLANAWQNYTESDGAVLDPLLPAGSPPTTDASARFMIIMMADAMLKLSAEDASPSLASTAERILSLTTSLPALNDPFNLLALASLVQDGEDGRFPASAWAQIAAPVENLIAQITFPTEGEQKCFYGVGCYSNWRLVWAAGASVLLNDHLPGNGTPGTLLSDPGQVSSEIDTDLSMALAAAGKPTKTSTGLPIRELSDPGEEPLSYHIFSIWMLNAVTNNDPAAVTPAIEQLKQEADDYAQALMAPDGQLSLAGRSLDQSWVQAAAASLGAQLGQQSGDASWDAFANRALSYLMTAYPVMPDGTVAIVPGLAFEWNPDLVDGYAEYNQYDALTLWFLVEALPDWSTVAAPAPPAASPEKAASPKKAVSRKKTANRKKRGPSARRRKASSERHPASFLPGDGPLLVDDLGSSGLVWGRSGDVWWMISGRTTAQDRRSEQGMVAVKVYSEGRWQDVLALRPLQLDLTSAWRMTFEDREVTPIFTSVTGSGHEASLHGYFPLSAHFQVPAVWRLTTTALGVRVSLWLTALPEVKVGRGSARTRRASEKSRLAADRQYGLSATVWTTSLRQSIPSNTWGSAYWPCVVSASGPACPIALYWRVSRDGHSHANLTIGL